MSYWPISDAVHTLERFRGMRLPQRCLELANYFKVAPTKDLVALFPLLIREIFGDPMDPMAAGWKLMTTSSAYHTSLDQETLYPFLAPDGPLLGLVYKLLDPAIKYDFPLGALPECTRKALETGGQVTSFLASKLCPSSAYSVPPSLQLNTFEFYIFHFAHYITKPIRMDNLPNAESVYSYLLQKYLGYFLPLEDNTIPPLPSDSFRGSTSVSGASQQFISPHTAAPSQETWRSETLLFTLLEFWLSNLELPNSELLIMVRILIKHLHYFANSASQARASTTLHPCAPSPPFALNLLKCMVIPQVLQKRLYSYFSYVFHGWPLDTSFRNPVEAWLSYIQPWRYLNGIQASTDDPVDPHWSKFVAENLQFYTTLLLQILPRFFRMELDSYKNVQCLYRIARVMSQVNLVEMILEAESQHPILSDPNYVPLHSDSMRTMVCRLIQRLWKARAKLNSSLSSGSSEGAASQSMWNWLNSIWTIEDLPADQTALTLDFLDLSMEYLAKIFKLDVNALVEEPCEELNRQVAMDDLIDPTTQTLTDLGRRRVLNGTFQAPIRYRGHPDEYYICSYEIAWLVRLLYRISTELNERYGERFQERYQRHDLIGWACRRLLAPPTVYYLPTRTELPARLRLRELGRRCNVIAVAVVLVVAYAGGFMGLLLVGALAVFGLVALVLVGFPSS